MLLFSYTDESFELSPDGGVAGTTSIERHIEEGPFGVFSFTLSDLGKGWGQIVTPFQ